MTLARGRYRQWTRVVAIITACGAIAWVFDGVNLPRVMVLLSGIGPVGGLLVLLPQLLSCLLETWGWRLSLPLDRIRYLALLRVRIGTESAAACLPAGVVLSESLKLPLLVKSCGFSVPGAIAAVAARKYLLLTSQGVYIAVVAGLGWGALSAASTGSPSAGIPAFLLLCGVLVFGAGLGVRVLLSQGRAAVWIREKLMSVPLARLRAALERHSSAFAEADNRFQRFFALGFWRETAVTAVFLTGWLCESLETFLILRLLGVNLEFFEVAGMEAGLSLLRSVVFVVPSGLGIQDAGYVLFLRAAGVPNAVDVGAAFTLLKRSKEIFWAVIGFGLLGSELASIAPASSIRHENALSP